LLPSCVLPIGTLASAVVVVAVVVIVWLEKSSVAAVSELSFGKLMNIGKREAED
jgi:hypothetical protein